LGECGKGGVGVGVAWDGSGGHEVSSAVAVVVAVHGVGARERGKCRLRRDTRECALSKDGSCSRRSGVECRCRRTTTTTTTTTETKCTLGLPRIQRPKRRRHTKHRSRSRSLCWRPKHTRRTRCSRRIRRRRLSKRRLTEHGSLFIRRACAESKSRWLPSERRKPSTTAASCGSRCRRSVIRCPKRTRCPSKGTKRPRSRRFNNR